MGVFLVLVSLVVIGVEKVLDARRLMKKLETEQGTNGVSDDHHDIETQGNKVKKRTTIGVI